MSVTNKEKNFISAVVYLHNDGAQAVRFFNGAERRAGPAL